MSKISETSKQVSFYFERFNYNYGNLIDVNKVLDAIESIENDSSKFPSIVTKRFDHGAKGLYFEGKIYVKENVEVDVLFHEILHFITREHGGLKYPLIETYPDNILEEKLNKYGDSKFADFVEQLDESMTRFVTELAIPEVKISDSYEYGSNFLRTYYDGLVKGNVDPSFIFSMYLNGTHSDVSKFKDSFGDKFEDVLESIERMNNIRFYILKKPTKEVMSKEQLDKVTMDAVGKVAADKNRL